MVLSHTWGGCIMIGRADVSISTTRRRERRCLVTTLKSSMFLSSAFETFRHILPQCFQGEDLFLQHSPHGYRVQSNVKDSQVWQKSARAGELPRYSTIEQIAETTLFRPYPSFSVLKQSSFVLGSVWWNSFPWLSVQNNLLPRLHEALTHPSVHRCSRQ
jgi:hypothetical protein